VIGGGCGGLIVTQELLEKGFDVTCFEALPRVGGVYVRTYKEAILTTSSLLSAFSKFSDGKESSPIFWNCDEYLDYLDNFVEHFNLAPHIHLRTKVLSVEQVPGEDGGDSKWSVIAKGGQAAPPCLRYSDEFCVDLDEPEETYEFDAVCICTGTHTWESLPHFEGQEAYLENGGIIWHAEDYKQAEDTEGKRVLIIGVGESGSDICAEVSRFATDTGIVCRDKHGHIIPRSQANGRVTDLNTNRVRYSNPYILGDWVGYANQMAKKFVASMGPQTEQNKVLQKIGEMNMEQGTSAFSKFGCKNEGFVDAIVNRGTKLFRGKFTLREGGVDFADGSSFDCDIIIACTGYRLSFPPFEEHHPEIVSAGKCPRSLYKQVILPEYEGKIAFFGFARPAFGSVPPTVEMQARFYSMVLNGEIPLPSVEEMKAIAKVDGDNYTNRFKYDSKRVAALVDFQIYCDDLAAQIGCLPPLRELFFKKPAMWYKIMFGPFTMHQYRFSGPYADPQRAESVLDRTPVGDFLESSITIAFLLTAKFLSMIGFKQFTPNNF
jgi:dimethylaniline monooxygenase (N-oxide forming)